MWKIIYELPPKYFQHNRFMITLQYNTESFQAYPKVQEV